MNRKSLITTAMLTAVVMLFGGCGDNGDSSSLTAGAKQQLPAPDEFVAVDVMPTMTEQAEVVYPEVEKNNRIEGTVWVRALVDDDGNVVDAIAEKTSGNDNLDRAALDAALKNKFTPATKDGRPVATWVTYSVDFVTAERPVAED